MPRAASIVATRRFDIAGHAEIVAVQMQGMRHLEIDQRLLQALDDAA